MRVQVYRLDKTDWLEVGGYTGGVAILSTLIWLLLLPAFNQSYITLSFSFRDIYGCIV
jgi:hypothetical protein